MHIANIVTRFKSDTVPIRTVNRQCSSGLQAVSDVAACIKAGFYDIGKGYLVSPINLNAEKDLFRYGSDLHLGINLLDFQCRHWCWT